MQRGWFLDSGPAANPARAAQIRQILLPKWRRWL